MKYYKCVSSWHGFTIDKIYELDDAKNDFLDDFGDNRRSIYKGLVRQGRDFFNGFFMEMKEVKAEERVPPMKNRIEELTKERGARYGLAEEHFETTEAMYAIWLKRRHSSKDNNGAMTTKAEHVLRHIVFMVIDKLVRMAQDPLHQDNYDDIQGYASLWQGYTERNPDEIEVRPVSK